MITKPTVTQTLQPCVVWAVVEIAWKFLFPSAHQDLAPSFGKHSASKIEVYLRTTVCSQGQSSELTVTLIQQCWQTSLNFYCCLLLGLDDSVPRFHQVYFVAYQKTHAVFRC